MARIILHPRRARPFYGRHPWVYAGAVAEVEGDPADGDPVDVFSHGGAFIARGLYNGRSRIRVRLYSWDPDQQLDRTFFRDRLDQAVRLRRDVLRRGGPGRACRLVFSEGDGLSGMTVDQYDRWLVVQFTGLGLANLRQTIAEVLAELCQPEGIVLRTERGIGKLEGLDLEDGPLWGKMPEGPVAFTEGDVTFLVNLLEGQKTGAYLDQWQNHRSVAAFAPGRRVLDAFCYTGGFGLHAAKAGAKEVVAVDVSAPALDLGRQNAERNGLGNVAFQQGEVFEWLETAIQGGQKFDLVVLDPPKFARAQRAVEDALRGYRRLQSLGVMLLNPGGILVTCCCSGLITMTHLEELTAQVAADSRRPVQILERHHQPPDHPVSAYCLESSYLKCLVARVG